MENEIDYSNWPYREAVYLYIFNSEGEFLIAQPSAYTNLNEWSLIGGGVEEGETHEEAALREAEEELGISRDLLKILRQSKYVYQYDFPEDRLLDRLGSKGEKYRGQRRVQFIAEFLGSKADIKLADEIRQIKWIKVDEFHKYFIFPNQLENIMKVVNEFPDIFGKQ